MAQAELLVRIRANAQEAQEAFKQVGAGLQGVDRQALAMGRSMGAARADTANLAAQFQDIGVMLASGQSPLLLAIQQGSQISQVLGPMGARGAVQALGSAFLGLINPVTFITIGAIAGGATLVQWLISAGEEVKDLDTAVRDLEASIKRVQDHNSNYSLAGFVELQEKYGEVNAELLLMIERQREAFSAEAVRDARIAIASMRSDLNSFFDTEEGDIIELLGTDFLDALDGGYGQAGMAYVRQFQEALNEVEGARTWEEQAEGVKRLLDLMEGTAAEGGELWASLLDVQDALLRANKEAEGLQGWFGAAFDGIQDLIGAIPGLTEALRLAGDEAERLNFRNPLDAYTQYQGSRRAGVAAAATADRLTIARAVAARAAEAGLDPAIILAVMGVESGLNTGAVGGAGGNYEGLIQFGPWEREHYGVSASSGAEEQAAAAVQFMLDRGVRPGETDPARYYAAVLAGNANLIGSGDTGNGGRVGQVSEFVQGQEFADWFATGQGLLRSINGGTDPVNPAIAAGREREEEFASDRLAAIERGEAEAAREAERQARLSEQAREAEARAVEQADRAYRSLAGSLDPVVAAQQALAQGQAVVNEALANGTISAEEAAAAMEMLGERFSGELLDLALENITEGAGEAADELQRMQEQSQRGAERLTDLFMSVMDGSASAKEAVAGLIAELARVQIMKGLMGLGDNVPIIGDFLGALGGGLQTAAIGGAVYPGRPVIVGEMGPELLLPRSPGRVIPNHRLPSPESAAAAAGGAMRMQVDVRAYVDQDGNWRAEVQRQAATVAGALDRDVQRASREALPRQVKAISRDPRRN